MAADSTLTEFNKIVPNLVLASKCTAAQTNQERHSRNQILKHLVEICTIFHFVFESFLSNHLEIIFLAAAAEGIFIEGVNFQRITNSKRILNSWFRFETFWMIFSWKNAIGIGKMSLRRRFTKLLLVVRRKVGEYLEEKLFTCEASASNDWIVVASSIFEPCIVPVKCCTALLFQTCIYRTQHRNSSPCASILVARCCISIFTHLLKCHAMHFFSSKFENWSPKNLHALFIKLNRAMSHF